MFDEFMWLRKYKKEFLYCSVPSHGHLQEYTLMFLHKSSPSKSFSELKFEPDEVISEPVENTFRINLDTIFSQHQGDLELDS
jgi:hypothetical protein